MNAPEIIRVKRKRETDSVHALLLEDDVPSKRGKFVFKLAKTVEFESYAQHRELNTPLLKLSHEGDARHFTLEQRKRKLESTALPTEISEMLDDYLSLNSIQGAESKPGKLKRSNRRKSEAPVSAEALSSIAYVYDIYYREVVPEDEFIFDASTVGYIKIVEDNGDMIPEEEDDDQSARLSDDEDSNEEAYYRNDYPEDEDDDRSVLFANEEVPGALSKGIESSASDDELAGDEQVGLQLANAESDSAREHIATLGDDETNALFDRYAAEPDILQAAENNFYDVDDNNEDNGNLSDMESELNDADFERHNFFPTDAEDPLAMHRDRIFGRLERMIQKK
ncbi:LANO_0G08746g1_1 [Lachancea nothofagi CBS 11611]|uniref:LANO_0G08746g1_1 n=1 Tax=Lachancea nothofagi CBS 11611 TaxID=1266666 RepID=A0A1G4KIE5_9SACH|nr:LANO_0G08746g1_1 [Lachancea nothofagi CBS 11611]